MNEKRRRLLELLARGDGNGGEVPQALLSPSLNNAQKRLLFLDQLDPDSAHNNIAFAFEIPHLDRSVVAKGLARLCVKHPDLRSVIDDSAEPPVFVWLPDHPLPLQWCDDAAQFERLAAEAARNPFRLTAEPPIRLVVLDEGGSRGRAVVVFSHVAVDGSSVRWLLDDLALVCNPATHGEFDAAPPPPAARLVNREPDEKYWQQLLADLPDPTSLPQTGNLERPRREGGHQRQDLPAELLRSLRRTARDLGVSEAAIVVTAVATALSRISQTADVLIGMPFADRDLTPQPRIGMLVRTLLLRLPIQDDKSIGETVQDGARAIASAIDNCRIDFDEISRLSGRAGSDVSQGTIRTLVGWHDFVLDSVDWNGKRLKVDEIPTGSTHFDLTVNFATSLDEWYLTVDWSLARADRACVDGFLTAVQHILEAVTTDFEQLLGGIQIAPPPPTVTAASASHRPGPRETSLADSFVQQAERTPSRTAIVDPTGARLAIDYRGLSERITRLAHQLRLQGVRPGSRVALSMERSTLMVVAVHAVALAGASYIPVDPGAPSGRRHQLLGALGSPPLLCDARALDPDYPGQVLLADDGCDVTLVRPGTSQAGRSAGSAYVLHTSGSTGIPKAVDFPVDASQAFLSWLQSFVGLTPQDNVLLKTPYGFDVSVWELFWPLQTGARLTVAEPWGHADPEYIARVIADEHVTVANFVPSMLERFIAEPRAKDCTSLRWILSAGEALSSDLCARVGAVTDARLVNLYGPTETGAVTYRRVDTTEPPDPVPIGVAVPHAVVTVRDCRQRRLPDGVPGEIVVGGPLGTATGYLGDPRQTARRFVPDGVRGQRAYLTGDIGRRNERGELEYLGRADRQVKLAGVRVEPGEIEAVISDTPDVDFARVLLEESGPNPRLVAFWGSKGTITSADVRRHISVRLPPIMLPDEYVKIDTVPLSPNGKTDWDALSSQVPSPAPVRPTGTDPSFPVAAAFADVLGRSDVAPDDTFFELGGSSLQLVRLARAIELRLGWSPSLRQLAEDASPAAIAERMEVGGPGAVHGNCIRLAGEANLPILFAAPAVTGSVTPYQDLATALRDVVQTIGYHDVDDPSAVGGLHAYGRKIGEAARKRLDLKSRESAIIGWSFGGALAYEAAANLATDHGIWTRVILLDCWMPGVASDATNPWRDGEGGAELGRRAGGSPGRLDAALALYSEYSPTPDPGLSVMQIASSRVAGRESVAPPDRGWSKVVLNLRTHTVGGDHFEMLTRESYTAYIDVLKEFLIMKEGV